MTGTDTATFLDRRRVPNDDLVMSDHDRLELLVRLEQQPLYSECIVSV